VVRPNRSFEELEASYTYHLDYLDRKMSNPAPQSAGPGPTGGPSYGGQPQSAGGAGSNTGPAPATTTSAAPPSAQNLNQIVSNFSKLSLRFLACSLEILIGPLLSIPSHCGLPREHNSRDVRCAFSRILPPNQHPLPAVDFRVGSHPNLHD